MNLFKNLQLKICNLQFEIPAKRVTGFTLIEILTVVLILAVIIGIALPVAQTAFEKMRISQARSDIAGVELALEGYKTQHGEYPNASPAERVPVDDLDEFMKFPAKRVIANVFYDPWNVPYRYSEPGLNHPSFADIASAGPDRQINGSWQTDDNLYGAADAGDVNDDNLDNWSEKR